MSIESKSKLKDELNEYGCNRKPKGFSQALTINQHSSTSNSPNSLLRPIGNEEMKAIAEYNLQVEQRRSIAVDKARRSTYL
ncbi:MAG: hypothetical protein JSV64_03970 [Candidatus Bathyarchaeota archaeon]|nr:MAG: hypothetical protein JSV64_03970 [Candidatus Bathyarchaeota archaeon]